MEKAMSDIQAPIMKASTSLLASGGSTLLASKQTIVSFLPTDAIGWMSLLASCVACAYSLTLWAEWWWKKFWKPLLRHWGWLQ